MMSIDLERRQFMHLQRFFKQGPEKVGTVVKRELTSAARIVRGIVKPGFEGPTGPVTVDRGRRSGKFGHLADSIEEKAEADAKGLAGYFAVRVNKSKRFLARWHEFGTGERFKGMRVKRARRATASDRWRNVKGAKVKAYTGYLPARRPIGARWGFVEPLVKAQLPARIAAAMEREFMSND